MKTLLRTVVWLALILWLGGELFFPITAWAAFTSIADTHLAGTIVAKCLAVLHHEGLAAGCVIVLFLAIGRATGLFRRTAIAGIILALLMLGLTAFSQFWIIPKMEGYRIAAGGAIDAVPPTDPNRIAFNKLHGVSEETESGILLLGVILVVLFARE